MNAYELADELLRDNTQLTVKAAYMLRQQADLLRIQEYQIEMLTKAKDDAQKGLETAIDFGKALIEREQNK